MPVRRTIVVLVTISALVAACSDDDDNSGSDASTSTAGASTTATTVADLEQPAIWPASDVVFATAEEAAEDFVTNALGVPPTLGELQQGDARSGEIEVFSPGEGNGTQIVRSRLLLRQLGPDDGWFVLAAVNDETTITSPAAMGEVPAAPLEVTGQGRGFEGNLVVRAFVAGDAGALLDEQVTTGGALEDPEPFSVTVDLSDAEPGDTVVLLVRGGTGLETDPGEVSAIPVVIAG